MSRQSCGVLGAFLILRLLVIPVAGQADAPESGITGESWLHHLHRSFNETSMGKTGHLGPAAPMPGEEEPEWLPKLSSQTTKQTLELTGADLYRLNCRGCHGEAGLGAPPEINSVINPVRATSAQLLTERMKNSGLEVSHADAAQMARQAKDALLLRFQKGGESMPPFDHLRPMEKGALVGYLNELAGVPGGAERETVKVPPTRVGELIVKSTCHICHDATGTNPSPQRMLEGAIPPLSALTGRVDEAEFIRKVTHGAPVLMGDPAIPQRGRMPVFYYLSEDEAADVYRYLMLYPPQLSAGQQTIATNSNDREDGMVAAALSTGGFPNQPPTPPAQGVDGASLALFSGLASFVILLLFAGLAITIYQFKKLTLKKAPGMAKEQPGEAHVLHV